MGWILIDVVIIVCAFWVFYDAATNKIGSYRAANGVSAGYRVGMPPLVWGLSCLLIFPFFVYLFRRRSLTAAAQENPVITDKSSGFILLFLIIALVELYNFREILFY